MPFASRFVVGSVDELVEVARGAIPSVAVGERAEIRGVQSIVLTCVAITPFVEWRELDDPAMEEQPCNR